MCAFQVYPEPSEQLMCDDSMFWKIKKMSYKISYLTMAGWALKFITEKEN